MTDINSGDLVNLFAYSPHDSELACTPLHTGIFLNYDHDAMDVAWLILVDGEISSYSKTWWKIKSIQTRSN
jgi:hypothetical protein|tara:strand:+ start:94 stop:306 length:213 start_codon:yes stop_codon:yes gene_type:complete